MKIGIIAANRSVPWGGSEYLWFELAKRIVQNGHELELYTNQWGLQTPQQYIELEELGVNFNYHQKIYLSRKQRILNRLLPKSLQKREVVVEPDYSKVDLMVISQGHTFDGAIYMEECANVGVDYVTISQAAGGHLWPDPSVYQFLRSGLKSATMNYFVSQENLNRARWQVADDLGNAKVIFNPVNISSDQAIPFPRTDKGYHLAVVARFEFGAKGHDMLFQVIENKKWRDRNITFNLFGHTGPQHELIKDIIKWKKLHNVVVHDFSDAEYIWSNNHMLVLPSRYEGLPLAQVEAMLAGRPILVTKAGGTGEIFEDDVEGFLVAHLDEESIESTLQYAWDNRERWQEMGMKARNRCLGLIPSDPADYLYEEIISQFSIKKV